MLICLRDWTLIMRDDSVYNSIYDEVYPNKITRNEMFIKILKKYRLKERKNDEILWDDLIGINKNVIYYFSNKTVDSLLSK